MSSSYLILLLVLVLIVVAGFLIARRSRPGAPAAKEPSPPGPAAIPVSSTGTYDRAIALEPRRSDVHSRQGTVFGIKADHDRAIADFDKAIVLNPDDAHAHYFRGRVFKDKGKYQKAIADFDRAIHL